jgi:UDP-GlcNAc:undecaprenyl-phosphate/decaprenyl-phosphate GlcNAc-1-phosphate transferase
MEPVYMITPFGFSMIVTIMLIPVWISVCRKWSLFDEPDSRKHHSGMTPSMGGIAIFCGIFCSFLVFGQINDNMKLQYLLGAVLILFFTGFFDDLINVNHFKKLVLQSVSAIVAFYGGFRLQNLDGLFGIHEIPLMMQLPLTLWFVVLFTNAYNFIDGVDGLAGSIGVIMTSAFGAIFYHYGLYDYAILSFCFTGALLGFLYFNFSPAQIFMGDTGSLVIGFSTAIMSIELFNAAIINPAEAVEPSYIFAVLFIPLFDFTRVVILRSINGTSPFKADRNHIHHMILSHGFGHRSVAFLMAGFHLMILSVHQLNLNLNDEYFIMLSVVMGVLFFNSKTMSALSHFRDHIFGYSRKKAEK